jgi:hypothetical protein
MACNKCGYNKCCCPKKITQKGPKGERGERGPQGLAGPPGQNGEDGQCPCEQVHYHQTRGEVIPGEGGLIAGTSYTVPVGGDGLYRFEYSAHAAFANTGGAISTFIRKNGVIYVEPNRLANFSGGIADFPFHTMKSNISLSAGDTIDMIMTSTDLPNAKLLQAVTIINKIG